MRLYGLIIFLLSGFSLISQSDDYPITKDGYIVEPKEFSGYMRLSDLNEIYDGDRDISTLEFNKGGRNWIVYSDKENNQTFTASDLEFPQDKLGFMEPLFVKEIDGNNLKVHSGEKNVFRGWINVSELVLSKYAVLNNQGSPKKAMALISLKPGQDIESFYENEKDKYVLYGAPSNDREYKIKTSATFKIRFIFKETPTFKLLANTDKLGSNKIRMSRQVAGWMEQGYITNWDSRLCLEPATNSRSVDSYKDKEIPIFLTKRALDNNNQDSKNNKSSIHTSVLKRELQSPYTMRMPILENIGGRAKTKKVATVGRLNSDESRISEDPIVGFKESGVALVNKLENTNILFVIDGTKSMGKYYPAVAGSMKEIISSNRISGTNHKLKFGLVVYRDYPDKENMVEVVRLNRNPETILAAITDVTIKSLDKDLPEAQFQGLIKGIKGSGLIKGQNNVVVLIGDAGNHVDKPKDYQIPDDYQISDVVKVLNYYGASFISFQVFNGRDQTFVEFNFQSKEYIKGIAEKIEGSPTFKFDLHKTYENTYELTFYDDDKSTDISALYPFGRFTYARTDDPMSTEILKRNVVDAVVQARDNLTMKVEAFRNIVEGADDVFGSSQVKFQNAALKEYCQNYVAEGRGTFQRCMEITRNLKQVSFEGFTNMKFYSKNYEAYEPVVFLSIDEFDEVKKTLDKINGARSGGKKRKALAEALLEQTKKMLGDVSDDNVKEMTLNEIWEIILNMPFDKTGKYRSKGKNGKALGDIKLMNIVNADKDMVYEFLADFESKMSGFGPSKYYRRSFEMAGSKFYWVPLKDFPGNNE